MREDSLTRDIYIYLNYTEGDKGDTDEAEKFYVKLKSWANKSKDSSNPFLRGIGKSMMKEASVLRNTKRCITDKEFRSVKKMQILHGNRVHQTSQVTCMNRYPDIFFACQQFFLRRENGI